MAKVIVTPMHEDIHEMPDEHRNYSPKHPYTHSTLSDGDEKAADGLHKKPEHQIHHKK